MRGRLRPTGRPTRLTLTRYWPPVQIHRLAERISAENNSSGEVVRDDRPLAEAARDWRRRERAQRQAAKAPAEPAPQVAETLAVMRASRTAHEKKLAAVRALFGRVVGQCSPAQLDRLIGALELFERGLARRHT